MKWFKRCSWLFPFFFFQARKEMASTKSPPRSQIWADICGTLNFPNESPWVQLPLTYITIFLFLPFDHKRYLKATNNCIHRFTCRILFDANRYTLVKRWAIFFFIKEKNGYTKTLSADTNTSWCLPHSISSKWQSVSVATVYPIEDAFPIWL